MRTNDPTQIDQADLRAFAGQAVWVAKLERQSSFLIVSWRACAPSVRVPV